MHDLEQRGRLRANARYASVSGAFVGISYSSSLPSEVESIHARSSSESGSLVPHFASNSLRVCRGVAEPSLEAGIPSSNTNSFLVFESGI